MLYRVRWGRSLQEQSGRVVGGLGSGGLCGERHAIQRCKKRRRNGWARGVVGALLPLFAVFSTEVWRLYINLTKVRRHGLRCIGRHGRTDFFRMIRTGGCNHCLRLRARALTFGHCTGRVRTSVRRDGHLRKQQNTDHRVDDLTPERTQRSHLRTPAR